MNLTVTYDVDDEMIETIDELLESYEPSDFENQDDRDVFLSDIASALISGYEPSFFTLEESICHMLEEYLKQKGWINGKDN